MKKKRIEELIPIANKALVDQYKSVKEQDSKTDNAILQENEVGNYVLKSNYDGKISAFGVSVAISGLLPTIAMYHKESGDVKTKPILAVIVAIIAEDKEYEEIKEASLDIFLKHALDNKTDLSKLKKHVLDAAIALKQVIRTYEQIKEG